MTNELIILLTISLISVIIVSRNRKTLKQTFKGNFKMTKAKNTPANYTDENVARMTSVYTEAQTDETRKGAVDFLANELAKSTKSIIAKLSREGIYIKAAKATKTGAKVETKAEIVAEIAANLNLDADVLKSLSNATKAALDMVRQAS
jgi:hypothetical protein